MAAPAMHTSRNRSKNRMLLKDTHTHSHALSSNAGHINNTAVWTQEREKNTCVGIDVTTGRNGN